MVSEFVSKAEYQADYRRRKRRDAGDMRRAKRPLTRNQIEMLKEVSEGRDPVITLGYEHTLINLQSFIYQGYVFFNIRCEYELTKAGRAVLTQQQVAV